MNLKYIVLTVFSLVSLSLSHAANAAANEQKVVVKEKAQEFLCHRGYVNKGSMTEIAVWKKDGQGNRTAPTTYKVNFGDNNIDFKDEEGTVYKELRLWTEGRMDWGPVTFGCDPYIGYLEKDLVINVRIGKGDLAICDYAESNAGQLLEEKDLKSMTITIPANSAVKASCSSKDSKLLRAVTFLNIDKDGNVQSLVPKVRVPLCADVPLELWHLQPEHCL